MDSDKPLILFELAPATHINHQTPRAVVRPITHATTGQITGISRDNQPTKAHIHAPQTTHCKTELRRQKASESETTTSKIHSCSCFPKNAKPFQDAHNSALRFSNLPSIIAN